MTATKKGAAACPGCDSQAIACGLSGRVTRATLFACLLMLIPWVSEAATETVPPEPPGGKTADDVVSYEAAFFDRYSPTTALEIVSRLPGFIIDDGADKRGFGAAAGNVLINDRYPSAKQEKPSDILGRIPADQVERIELIRGQIRGIDLRGKSVVVSVILRTDIPAVGRWDLAIRENFSHPPLTVSSASSLSDTWGSVEYNAGLYYRHFRSAEFGTEDVMSDAGSLLEAHDQGAFLKGDEGNASLTMSTWLGDILATMNGQFAFEDRVERTSAESAPRGPGAEFDDTFVDEGRTREMELGADGERRIGEDILGKGILLYTRKVEDNLSTQASFDQSGNQSLFRVADSEVAESEAIARTEIYWVRNKRQSVNVNLEAARNVIDGTLTQTTDTGSGPMDVPVPGGNIRVQEDRFDVLVNSTSYFGAFEIGYGLGAEKSVLSQSGDAAGERSFFFLKPQFLVSWSPSERRHTRFRVAREVSQLDFRDFVSSTVFQDDDIALGNPDLEPESTWLAELGEERRFGRLGAIKGTLFYNWISNVEDLLPLSEEFEAPGNIGSGRRYGIRLEATVPLDAIGLTDARLDLEARLQDSNVIDPVTGIERVLSGEAQDGKPLEFDVENRFVYGVDFRQDLDRLRFAWGGNLRRRGDRLAYKVNELVVYGDGVELNVFAETTRWLGLKLRLEGANLTNFSQERTRTFYVGERGLTAVDAVELQNIKDGRRVILSASGSF